MVSEERAESLAGQNMKSQLHPTLAGRNLPLRSLRHFSEYLKEGSARRLGCSSFLPLYTPVSWQEHYRMTARKGMLTVALHPWPWPWYEAFPWFDFISICDTPKVQCPLLSARQTINTCFSKEASEPPSSPSPTCALGSGQAGAQCPPARRCMLSSLWAGVPLSQARSPVSLSLLASVTPTIREHAAALLGPAWLLSLDT